MTVWRRSPVYPLCLLVGALLFGSAGLAHPLLTGDGPTQLAVIAGTPAIFVYDMLHPFGLAAERVATFTVGFALYAYGWGIRNGQVYPRWLGWLGIAIGATAAAVAVVFTEFSLNMFYAQALVVV